MKRLLAGLACVAAASLATAATADAQTAGATVTLLHGVPGATVDVVVDGQVVVPGFEPGTTQDLSAFAGQTLTNVEVRAAGTSDVVIGPIASLDVPASGNWTVAAHLGVDGTPTLTPFENDTSPLPSGQGRLTVRHTAAAPAVDVVLTDGSRPFTNLTNPNEASADLPAGPITGAQLAPTGGDPLAPVPDVELAAGTNLIVYAVGSLEDETLTFYTQTIEGLGGQPSVVNTGNSPVSDDSSTPLVLTVLAGVLGLSGVGLLAARRRS
jgi:MYXO-CTERM domain-containing protein